MDAWSPATFDTELCEVLTDHTDLIVDYHREDLRLMDAHLKSDPYESLRPNRFSPDFLSLREHTVTPLLRDRRIRGWHYTRLIDEEVLLIQRELEPSSLASLGLRLETLVRLNLLTQEEAEIVYRQSPFHSQDTIRSNRLWMTTVPQQQDHPGVAPLLESWGGESAYFWLSNNIVAEKLRNIGTPRIVEIETALRDTLNAFSVAETVIQAWVRQFEVSVEPSGCDLAITACLDAARVLRIHTKGDGIFEQVAKTYPDGCDKLLGN